MRFLIALILALSAGGVFANIPKEAIRTQSVADICTTKTGVIRNVSERIKAQIYRRDGVHGGNHTGICSGSEGCEVDHRISLELGGSNALDNLMIQPYSGPCNAHDKDRLEDRLHRMICAGEIQPRDAQELIYNDWESGYKRYVNPAGCR